MTEDEARKAYNKMTKVEEEFGDLFTGMMLSSCMSRFKVIKSLD